MNLTHRFDFPSNALHWLFVSSIGLISLGLLLGFLTPILSVIACLAAGANLLLAGGPITIDVTGLEDLVVKLHLPLDFGRWLLRRWRAHLGRCTGC